jgi:hypothetical protein
MKFIIGAFLILHGLVHLLYLGQSQRFFELQPGMVWPDDSWAFSELLTSRVARLLTSLGCGLAAFGFAVGGIAVWFGLGWWQPLVIGSALFSSVLYLLAWDGKLRRLDNQGGVGLLINLAILVAVLYFGWPDFG